MEMNKMFDNSSQGFIIDLYLFSSKVLVWSEKTNKTISSLECLDSNEECPSQLIPLTDPEPKPDNKT